MKLLIVLLSVWTCVFGFSSSEANVNSHSVDDDLHKLAEQHKDQLTGEKYQFQSEVNRVLKLIIHSLYKNKEVFLRELVSNASDALDKIRVFSLTQPNVMKDAPTLNITIETSWANRTIVIRDTGIGMTRHDLKNNLGTIAKSGTNEFLQSLESGADNNLIGQFGVGFYSAFLVAEKVTVISKHPNDTQHIWESYAENDFTITEDPRGNTLGRGTEITLHIKEDDLEFVEEDALDAIILRYSEYINFPIFLLKNRTVSEQVPLEEGEEGEIIEDENEVELTPEEIEAGVEKEVKRRDYKIVTSEKVVYDLMNANKPLWTRNPKEITEEEYAKFYQVFARSYDNPLSYVHFKAEGDVDFKSIIFIPEKPASGLLQSTNAHLKCFKLYVRRVFITDELLDFIPKYLNFLKGLIDSDDLPLNVSRETLQQNRLLKMIKKKIMRKALDLIKDISKDPVKYPKFLENYGLHLKYGVIEDMQNRKKLMRLLRFNSSASDTAISLDQYVENMKRGQTQIFFMSGPSIPEIKRSPFVEAVVARGYEVLYFTEPIDVYVVQVAPEFNRKLFQNVAKEGVVFGDEDEEFKEKHKELEAQFTGLAEYLKIVLAHAIDKVVVSHLLTTSPCAVVASKSGHTGREEAILMAQNMDKSEKDDVNKDYGLFRKKTLEINPKHPLIIALQQKVDENKIDETDDLVKLMYEMSSIRSGFQIRDTIKFADRIERMLRVNLGVDLNAKADISGIKPAPSGPSGEEGDESSAASSTEEEIAKMEAELGMNDDEHDEL
jgi:heat shock protein beta